MRTCERSNASTVQLRVRYGNLKTAVTRIYARRIGVDSIIGDR